MVGLLCKLREEILETGCRSRIVLVEGFVGFVMTPGWLRPRLVCQGSRRLVTMWQRRTGSINLATKVWSGLEVLEIICGILSIRWQGNN